MKSLIERMKERREILGHTAKRSLGQNFLISENVVSKIIQRAEKFGLEQIIEIGPGLGALTDELRTKFTSLQLLELDHDFVTYWRDQEKLSVTECDALHFAWNDLADKTTTCLVSNLPYQISSTLVIDRSLDTELLGGMVLMFQKEVAQRLRAQPKTAEFGFLSVIAQSFWQIEIVCEAGPKDFQPAPKIASRVLAFTPKNKVDFPQDPKRFLQFVKLGFSHRRKLLNSNLASWGRGGKPDLGALGFSPTARAEELSISDWHKLYRSL